MNDERLLSADAGRRELASTEHQGRGSTPDAA